MINEDFALIGNIVDVVNRRIFPGIVHISQGRITSIEETENAGSVFILPGLIDAHIHIESSMLIPSEFARLAVTHGTVATVSDPHEIANVLGVPGVLFMIENGRKVPFKFFFGAPSCVPATPFESAGAVFGVKETEQLLQMEDIRYLSEMMNFPGVLHHDPEVMAKLALARKYGKPVDGHAPGLRGEDALKYISAGISTDHECFSLEEAVEKARYGMKILIREGSAARNFDTLIPLLDLFPDQVMFCSDDRHPDDLVEKHIDDIVRRALARGYDLLTVLSACTVNPVRHYGLEVGLLQPGDPADMVIVSNLEEFHILETYIDGKLVASNGATLIGRIYEKPVNHFKAERIFPESLRIRKEGRYLKVIGAIDGELITHPLKETATSRDDLLESDTRHDILKMVVMNRYAPSPPSFAFVKGFGLNSGAIASTVAHDSHNIIAVGTNDQEMAAAINLLVECKGGICCVNGTDVLQLPLPFAGLMSGEDGVSVARSYENLDHMAKDLGSSLRSPFMTLSFMALLVIPALKLSDKGLFDGNKFEFTSLFLDQI
jgi:adenine deaminase